jgi:tetratricopeptide (TPR) repeat protein
LAEKGIEASAVPVAVAPTPVAWQGVTLAVVALIAVTAGIVGWASPGSISAAVASSTGESAVGPRRVANRRPVDAAAVAQHRSADAGRAGYAAYASGDMASAVTSFEAAAEAKPDEAEARNNLGQILVHQNRAAEALPHFDAAVESDPRKWAYRFNRARAYGVLERWTEAVDEYKAAAQIFPSDYATHYNLGLALMKVKDYPGAVAELTQAVAQAPGETSFLMTLGTACVEARQLARAKEVFQLFLELAPDAPEAPRVKAILEALNTSSQA